MGEAPTHQNSMAGTFGKDRKFLYLVIRLWSSWESFHPPLANASISHEIGDALLQTMSPFSCLLEDTSLLLLFLLNNTEGQRCWTTCLQIMKWKCYWDSIWTWACTRLQPQPASLWKNAPWVTVPPHLWLTVVHATYRFHPKPCIVPSGRGSRGKEMMQESSLRETGASTFWCYIA